jgi:hypothetical protein
LPELAEEVGVWSEEEEMVLLSDALIMGGLKDGTGVVIRADGGGGAMEYAEVLRLFMEQGVFSRRHW